MRKKHREQILFIEQQYDQLVFSKGAGNPTNFRGVNGEISQQGTL